MEVPDKGLGTITARTCGCLWMCYRKYAIKLDSGEQLSVNLLTKEGKLEFVLDDDERRTALQAVQEAMASGSGLQAALDEWKQAEKSQTLMHNGSNVSNLSAEWFVDAESTSMSTRPPT